MNDAGTAIAIGIWHASALYSQEITRWLSNPLLPSNRLDDMHWGIAYLREDIQELRQDVRSLHERIDAQTKTFDAKFEKQSERMDAGFAECNKRTDSRFGLLLVTMVTLHGVTIATIVGLLQYYLT